MIGRSAEVVIIGAGVIGSSIAYQLSRRNVKVTVLERGNLSTGTSFACDGTVFLQTKSPGTHLRLALQSAQRFPHLGEELGTDIKYRKNGGMVVVEKREELEFLKCFTQKQKMVGLDVSLINREDALALEPCLSRHILASTYSEIDAQVNPISLTFGFIDAARRLGAKFVTGAEVIEIRFKSKQIASIITNKGIIQTEKIVNAAGAYAGLIGNLLHVKIPVNPRRGQILVTEAIPPIMKRCILSAQYISAKHNPAMAKIGGGGISVEQTVNGNLLIGSTREFVDFDKGVSLTGMRLMARQISKLIPRTQNLRIIRAFAGLRPHTPDGLPILSQVRGLEGFIIAAGHEGDGIALSPVTGELVADLIVDGTSKTDLTEFRLERFYPQ